MNTETKLRIDHYLDGIFGITAMNLQNEIDRHFSSLSGWTRDDVDQEELSYFVGWLAFTQLLHEKISNLDIDASKALSEKIVIRQIKLNLIRSIEKPLLDEDQIRFLNKFIDRFKEYFALLEASQEKDGTFNGLTIHVFEKVRRNTKTSGYTDHALVFPTNLMEWMKKLHQALIANSNSIEVLVKKQVNVSSSQPTTTEEKFVKHTALVAEWMFEQLKQHCGIKIHNNPIPTYCFAFYLCINWFSANYEDSKEIFIKDFHKNCINTFRNTLSPDTDLLDFVDQFMATYKLESPSIRTYVNEAIKLRQEKRAPSIRKLMPDPSKLEEFFAQYFGSEILSLFKNKSYNLNWLLEPTIFKLFSDYEELFDYGEVRNFNYH